MKEEAVMIFHGTFTVNDKTRKVKIVKKRKVKQKKADKIFSSLFSKDFAEQLDKALK